MKTRNNNGISVRLLVMILALTLIVGGIVGGSVAWLTATSATVTNTFTVGDIDITLAETTGNSYKVLPGVNLTKDPVVTVSSTSEDCWLFVKVAKSKWPTLVEDGTNTPKINYSIASGWELVTGTTDVYCRKVLSADTTRKFHVLSGDVITVSQNLTKSEMNSLPSFNLTITAYAVQLYKDSATQFTAEEAWAKIPTT